MKTEPWPKLLILYACARNRAWLESKVGGAQSTDEDGDFVWCEKTVLVFLESRETSCCSRRSTGNLETLVS